MAKFEHKESYKHLFAKELLYSWLKESNDKDEHCGISPIGWRSNYGIFMELRFHEFDDPYYFELSKGLYCQHEKEIRGINKFKPESNTDWFDPKIDRGKILFVPDITIFHKGTARTFVEIIKSNPVTEVKLNRMAEFYNGHIIEIYLVSADYILNLTEKPKELKIMDLIKL